MAKPFLEGHLQDKTLTSWPAPRVQGFQHNFPLGLGNEPTESLLLLHGFQLLDPGTTNQNGVQLKSFDFLELMTK